MATPSEISDDPVLELLVGFWKKAGGKLQRHCCSFDVEYGLGWLGLCSWEQIFVFKVYFVKMGGSFIEQMKGTL